MFVMLSWLSFSTLWDRVGNLDWGRGTAKVGGGGRPPGRVHDDADGVPPAVRVLREEKWRQPGRDDALRGQGGDGGLTDPAVDPVGREIGRWGRKRGAGRHGKVEGERWGGGGFECGFDPACSAASGGGLSEPPKSRTDGCGRDERGHTAARRKRQEVMATLMATMATMRWWQYRCPTHRDTARVPAPANSARRPGGTAARCDDDGR